MVHLDRLIARERRHRQSIADVPNLAQGGPTLSGNVSTLHQDSSLLAIRHLEEAAGGLVCVHIGPTALVRARSARASERAPTGTYAEAVRAVRQKSLQVLQAVLPLHNDTDTVNEHAAAALNLFALGDDGGQQHQSVSALILVTVEGEAGAVELEK